MIDLLIENASPTMNFWEIHPIFKSVGIFKNLYKKDMSRLKNKSSKMMWGFAQAVHPKSYLYRIKGKHELIARDIIKDKDFDWEAHSDYIEAMEDACLTQAEKSLVAWDNRLKSRDRFLDGQEYSFGYEERDADGETIRVHNSNVKPLDEMLSRTAKLYQEYLKIRKDLEEEDIKRGKANKPKSASDAGEI